MKDFLHFAFGFLYTRNWNTGVMELSRTRVIIFCSAVLFLLLFLLVIGLLQAPVEVNATEIAYSQTLK